MLAKKKSSGNTSFTLLTPRSIEKPSKNEIIIYEKQNLNSILSGILEADLPIAVDIETKGTQAANPDCRIVGLGMSNGETSVYFDRRNITEATYRYIINWLANPKLKLIGHNIFFDSAFLYRESKRWYNWVGCTYGLYRQLATEGWAGQSWALKSAQTELLGWQSTNEQELDEWLVDNNYYKNISKKPKDGYYLIDFKGEKRYAKPDKGQMFRAPAAILGYYCALDCYSTYRLYSDVLNPAIKKLVPTAQETFKDYHKTFLTNIKINVEQQLRGIKLDTEALDKHVINLEQGIKDSMAEFLNHPDIVRAIDKFNCQTRDAYHDKQPAKYTKSGKLSKNWEKWYDKYKQICSENHFNLNSGPQKQWLFYEELKFPVIIKTDKGTPATDKKAILGFGEPGKILKRYNDLEKELGYVNGCKDYLIKDTINPQFRIPGTLTGRLAGSSGLNIQQLPKSRAYLSTWIARPGHLWIDCDHTSLEQVVLAELSKDPTLLKLYGRDAKPNDVYLFNGSNLPIIGKQIRDAGYDPDNPTPEDIARAKKKAKKARGIAKVITLGSSYGMGPKKLAMTLNLEGIKITETQAQDLHSAYWDLYQGVKTYEQYLLGQYSLRKGWVYNGIGRPIGIYPDYLKDIVNRVVQSTGHDLHMIWVEIFWNLCKSKGLTVYPIVIDFHDQAIVECPKEQAEDIHLTFIEAYDILNKRLGPEIPLTGDPQIVSNLAEAKIDG